MIDNNGLISRLRTTPPNVFKEREAADALEAQDARIGRITKLVEYAIEERDNLREELAAIKAQTPEGYFRHTDGGTQPYRDEHSVPFYLSPVAPAQPQDVNVGLVQALKDIALSRNIGSAHILARTALSLARAAPVQGVPDDNTQVICPACTNQFRAIPVSVQRLMLDAGFEPPFTAAPQQEQKGGE